MRSCVCHACTRKLTNARPHDEVHHTSIIDNVQIVSEVFMQSAYRAYITVQAPAYTLDANCK